MVHYYVWNNQKFDTGGLLVMAQPMDCIIIEDEEAVSEMLEDFCNQLEVFRFVVKAKDAAVAESMLSKQKFDLILLDINLPKGGGKRIIKLFEPGFMNAADSVMVISGEIDKAFITDSLRVKIKNFLAKPFTYPDFEEKVGKILGARMPVSLLADS